MKRLILVITAITFLIVLPACKYNGEALVVVTNIGDLTINVILERVLVTLEPGEKEEFELSWPGKEDMHINVTTYPLAYKNTMGENNSFWIKNGETKYFEIEFYPPELSK